MLLNGKRIMLDPGHSGRTMDPGACGAMSVESDVAFAISQEVESILKNRWGATVACTKNSIDDVPSDDLGYRCEVSDAFNADILVSIHLNAAANTSAKGTETFSMSHMGGLLAKCIQKQLVACLGTLDRGLKDGSRLYMVKRPDAVAVLTEVCFISNMDEELMINRDYKKAAEAIAQGIVDYFVVSGGVSQ